jgi:hypothetical protein
MFGRHSQVSGCKKEWNMIHRLLYFEVAQSFTILVPLLNAVDTVGVRERDQYVLMDAKRRRGVV